MATRIPYTNITFKHPTKSPLVFPPSEIRKFENSLEIPSPNAQNEHRKKILKGTEEYGELIEKGKDLHGWF